ncbi:MAG: 50S ribosomal protein L23 [Anaerolineales bacterium]|nr:50S ribosomal protein L23 [Anaerolineales bacterium]
MTENLESVLRRPIISEKSIRLAKEHQFTFEVSPRATRILVKQAVERMFDNVEVAQVDIVVATPKKTRSLRTRRLRVRRKAYKKAIVTLSKGNIPIFEGVKG